MLLLDLRRLYSRPRGRAREQDGERPAPHDDRGVAVEVESGRQLVPDQRLRSAEEACLKVRTGDGEETVVGYDAQAAELYVDRTRPGRVDFSRDFPGVQRAALAARHGKVRLRILVDWSSVEVFADRGQTVITDQIFPSASSDGVHLFAEGGTLVGRQRHRSAPIGIVGASCGS